MGVRCPSCSVLLPPGADTCPNCRERLGPRRAAAKAVVEREEANILYEILKSFPRDGEDARELRRILERSASEPSSSLVDLSDPLRKVVRNLGEKLQLVEGILRQTRERLILLEGREGEAATREREVLSMQIRDLSREREELLDMRWGIEEIERIYRKLLLLQGVELKRRDRRFRHELESLKRDMMETEASGGTGGEDRSRVVANAEAVATARRTDDEIRALREASEELRRRVASLEDERREGAEEMARVLKALDDLLEELPGSVIKRFAASEDFRRYDKAFRKYVEGG